MGRVYYWINAKWFFACSESQSRMRAGNCLYTLYMRSGFGDNGRTVPGWRASEAWVAQHRVRHIPDVLHISYRIVYNLCAGCFTSLHTTQSFADYCSFDIGLCLIIIFETIVCSPQNVVQFLQRVFTDACFRWASDATSALSLLFYTTRTHQARRAPSDFRYSFGMTRTSIELWNTASRTRNGVEQTSTTSSDQVDPDQSH
jgi:hypothetical protein